MGVFCSSEEFNDLYKELAVRTQSVFMQVKGGSMYPSIRSGDWVEILPVKSKPELIRKGEIVLFIKDGHPYIHRIIKKNENSFVTKGDFSFGTDAEIPGENVIGRVVLIKRNERSINLYSYRRRLCAIVFADSWVFLQYIFLFFRKITALGIILISMVQGLKIYRNLIRYITGKDIIIRAAQPEDKEALRDLYTVMDEEEIGKSVIDIKKEGYWLIGQIKGRIAGSLTITRHEKDTNLWLIFGLVTKPLYRGLGIGELLVREAVKKAREFGAKEIGLFVNKKARAALSLYRKIGFIISTDFPAESNVTNDEVYMKYIPRN